MQQGDIALDVVGVSKSFGGVHAVSDASLQVRCGERHALIGPNGAGKTTLFNLIAGELPVDTGSITLFGKDITRLPVEQRARLGLGRTYQISQLFNGLTVADNLALAATRGRHRAFRIFSSRSADPQLQVEVEQVAETVRLAGRLGHAVSELSHGEQRQLEIGMVLAMGPELIMLDEPAAGLSPAERVTLLEVIEALPKGRTLILIEHDMELVLRVAERITVLNRGHQIAEGSPAEIRANETVQDIYLGSAAHHD
ncbi:MAG: ABC transporter ATP-binding protein [Propionicimonas sp.]|uniref:ABC transporter ATP-binding protein n=1 Tax=Propionicimonas sp. TaxID=1955623 RepID=UPI002B1EC52C|nr:ABC transporter ATP-binding protein [Propionicimonas sp.]MEA4944878.1 ABC transporter ATP-binding protein [Propionicimonas sp.]MEA5053096.1 ABC transporter ATP-binding protein [Propionicimonas sp.]